MSVRSFTVVACPKKKNNKNIDFLMSGLDPRTIDGGEEGPRFFFFVTLTVHACEFHNLDLCRGYDWINTKLFSYKTLKIIITVSTSRAFPAKRETCAFQGLLERSEKLRLGRWKQSWSFRRFSSANDSKKVFSIQSCSRRN